MTSKKKTVNWKRQNSQICSYYCDTPIVNELNITLSSNITHMQDAPKGISKYNQVSHFYRKTLKHTHKHTVEQDLHSMSYTLHVVIGDCNHYNELTDTAACLNGHC